MQRLAPGRRRPPRPPSRPPPRPRLRPRPRPPSSARGLPNRRPLNPHGCPVSIVLRGCGMSWLQKVHWPNNDKRLQPKSLDELCIQLCWGAYRFSRFFFNFKFTFNTTLRFLIWLYLTIFIKRNNAASKLRFTGTIFTDISEKSTNAHNYVLQSSRATLKGLLKTGFSVRITKFTCILKLTTVNLCKKMITFLSHDFS